MHLSSLESIPTREYHFSEQLERKLESKKIVFIPEKDIVTYEQVEKVRADLGVETLYVCDFYVQDIEKNGKYNGRGYVQGGIKNLDHHSPTPEMRDFVSTAVFALKEVEDNPDFNVDSSVLMHHTDTDSVFSSLIMSGVMSAEQARELHVRFAALAADHYGEENAITDLLQAIRNGEYKGQEISERLKFSVRNLEHLLNNQPLEEIAIQKLEAYKQERNDVIEKVKNGEYSQVGEEKEISFLELSETSEADAVVLPNLFKESLIAFIAKPKVDKEGVVIEGLYTMNIRLCKKGLEKNVNLEELMEKAGLPFGGRFNAGANKRKGGIQMTPQDFAQKMYDALYSDKNNLFF
jgi:hypothetical protein